MERNRNAKAKSLRAAGVRTVKTNRVPKRVSDDNVVRLFSKAEIVPFRPQPIYRRTIRWSFNGSFGTTAFSIANGHDQFLVVTTVGGNAICWADVWRIARIRLFARNNEQDEACHIDFVPTSADTADNFLVDLPRTITTISQSSSLANGFDLKTSKNHPLGMWHRTNNVNFAGALFSIGCASSGANKVDGNNQLEIDFEYVTNWNGLPNGYGIAGGGATTLGTMVGRNIMSGNLIIEGINST